MVGLLFATIMSAPFIIFLLIMGRVEDARGAKFVSSRRKLMQQDYQETKREMEDYGNLS